MATYYSNNKNNSNLTWTSATASSASSSISSNVSNATNGSATLSLGSYTVSPSTISTWTTTSVPAYSTLSFDKYFENEEESNKYYIGELIKNVDLPGFIIDALFADKKIASYIDLEKLLECQELRPDQIQKYIFSQKDSHLRALVFKFQTLSNDFISAMTDIPTFTPEEIENLCLYQCLNKKFITKYAKSLNWFSLMKNTKMKWSTDFILKHMPEIHRDKGINAMFSNSISLTNKQLNDILDIIDDQYHDDIDWNNVSWSVQLREDLVFKYIDFLDFNSILLATRKFKDDRIKCYIALNFGYLTDEE